jgi:tetratricopeptide (TPR) repeat protein
MVRWLGSLVALVVFAYAGPLAAQASSTDSEARVRFEAGRMAFAAERYEDALVDFERAYELSQRPVLLFNIAQSYARLGRNREAVDAYQHFLREAPEGEAGREEAEAQIVLLERVIASSPPEPVDEEVREPEAATPTARDDDPTGWVLVGVGGALTLAGAILTGVGLSDRFAVESPGPGVEWSDIMEAYDRGPILEAVGFSTLAVGLVGLTVGLILVLTSPSDEPPMDRAARAMRWSL